VVIWAQGKLWRQHADRRSNIAFNAEIEQATAPIRVQQRWKAMPSPRMLRDVATSPDGKTVLFHAVGHPEAPVTGIPDA
jgi:hypothetical protein